MRWFVDISAIGSGGGKASRFCVEAEQWQRALQSVRALRGDSSPFANFSIELLEDGYRAIDPATRSRYVVQKAPDDAELTTKPVEVPIIPSVPPPAPSQRPRNRSGDAPRARASERRRGRLSIPDDPVPRAVAPAATAAQTTPAIPPPAPLPAPLPADASATETGGEAKAPSHPPSNGAAGTPTSQAPRASAPPVPTRASQPPAVQRASEPPRAALPAPTGVSRPMQAETAFERMTAGLASFPLAQAQKAQSGAAPDVTTEVLPRFKILSERSEAPTASSPLTYREMAFAVSDATSYKDAEAIVRAQFEVVRAALRNAPKGQFITLAVFDHEFDGKPRRLPLATLSFKDWRDPEPVVRFPLRDARSSTNGNSPSNAPAAPDAKADLGQTQVNPTASVPIDAKRSDAALPKVDTKPPAAAAGAVSPSAPAPSGSAASAPPAARDSAPPSKRKPPVPTPSQIRRAAVEMARDDVTDVKMAEAIPDPPESLTQVMPPPVMAAEPPPAPKAAEVAEEIEVDQDPVDEAPSDAPTPAIEAGKSYSIAAAERGVFPAVTLPSGVEPLGASPGAMAFGVTAPAEPLSSAMRPLSQPPAAPKAGDATRASTPPVESGSPVSSARDTERMPSVPPTSGVTAPSAGPSAPPVSAPPDAVRASSPPAAARASAPPAATRASAPPVSAPPPSSAKPRVRDDDLISELFEALSDLEFLADPLEGADFVLSVALDNIPSEVAFVSFFSLDSREFVVVRASAGAPASLLLSRAGEKASLAARAMRAHQAVVLDRDAADAVSDDPRWLAAGVTPTSLVCAPVKLGGRYLGLIELANPVDGAPYTDGDGHAISYIAQQFAEFLGQRDVVLDADRISAPKLSARVRR